MTQAAKAQEPSMEEILASIRRIIADDDGKGAAAAKPAARAPAPPPPPAPPAMETPVPALDPDLAEPAPPEPEEAEILDLTDAMEAPAEGFRTIEPAQDLVFDEPAPQEPAAAMEVSEPEETFAEPEPAAAFHEPASTIDVARRQFERNTGEDRSLLSSTTTAAVDSAFNSLAQTVLVQNSRTLDDLVREMLRPMLKAWLDDNLPNMVERMVRAEIERVSRGRG
jgi:cell pole-organizing protein PopZ